MVKPLNITILWAVRLAQAAPNAAPWVYLLAGAGLALLAVLLGYWILDQRNRRRKARQQAEAERSEEHLARRKAEEQTRHSNHIYQALVTNFPNGALFLFDRDLRYALVEGSALDDAGLIPEALVGKTIWEVFGPEIHSVIEPHYRAALEGHSSRWEMVFAGRQYEARALPLRDPNGEIHAGIVITQDISRRKQAEAELNHQDARYRSLFEASPDAVTVTDLQGNILLSNQRKAELHGFANADELAGRNVVDYIAAEDRSRALENMHKVLELGSLYNTPYTFLRQDGSCFPGEMSISRMLDGDGHPVALTGITRDISERKQAEERIERQVERLATLRTIDLAISASLDLEVTLAVLLEHVITQLKVDAVDILLLNPYTQTFNYAAGRGFTTASAQHGRQRLAEGIAGRPAYDRQPVRMTAPAVQGSTTRLAALMEAEGFEVYYGVPLMTKGLWRGVLEIFHRQPLEPDQEWLDFLETLSGQAAIAISNAELFENLQQANQELTLTYDRTLEGWVRALDLRDHETENHTQRVAEQTVRLAQRMGLSDEDLVHVWRGALLHDIGKMGIPDRLLHKPDRLTPEEWVLMKQHTDYAQEMLAPISYLKPALEIPYFHHEKWDGSGYPGGLKGEEIPLTARIFAVIDVWDALRTHRVYRKEKPIWPEEEVRQYLRDHAGSHFDPQVVEVFLRMLEEEDKFAQ